jgi:hypothetical protein
MGLSQIWDVFAISTEEERIGPERLKSKQIVDIN